MIADPFGSDELAMLLIFTEAMIMRCLAAHIAVYHKTSLTSLSLLMASLLAISIILQDKVDPWSWTTTPAEQYNRFKYFYDSFWIKVVVPNVV